MFSFLASRLAWRLFRSQTDSPCRCFDAIRICQIQHKTNMLVIVMDNGTLGRVEFGFKDAKGCEIAGCDWLALAKAYGAEGACNPCFVLS